MSNLKFLILNILKLVKHILGFNYSVDSAESFCQKEVVEFIRSANKLTTISLRYRKIGKNCAKLLAIAIKYIPTLTSLNLKGITLGEKGAEYIADILGSNLSLIHI
eukprot:TRINITY_DN6123_c0_g3_i4.p1 TRINITY_DN6123_c0_g3~~TRINITY_DN6123_c0_g3_i4.p1  ORF type:complete len:106 (-),score=9.25 TRINITY_DN6123_c0_g3_i4:2-319(-)